MRAVIWIVGALLLAGCQQTANHSADLSFSRAPGLGYRNAGLFSPGRMYLFDQASGTLTRLSDDIVLERQEGSTVPTTLSATNISGIALSGAFPSAAAKVEAAVAIGSKVSFVAEKAVRERYSSVYTGLAKAYTDGTAAGQDMKGQWYVDTVIADPNQFYVVVTDIVKADKTSLSVGGLTNDNVVDVSVTVPGLPAPLKIAVSNGRLVECSGNASPCFFNVSVVRPYIGPNKLLAFRAATNFKGDALSEAFRKL